MAFRFSLAAVLRVRIIAEEQEERLLQKILFEINQTQEEITRLDEALVRLNEQLASIARETVSAYDVQACYEDIQATKAARAEQVARVEKLKELRAKQIVAYEQARRSREMLTDMRDTQKETYEAELTRAEQKALDDNFSSRRNRE